MPIEEIETIVDILKESASIANNSNDLASVISRIKTGQRFSLLLKQYEDRGDYNGETKSSDCMYIFFEAKELLIHKAMKRAMGVVLTSAQKAKNNYDRVNYYKTFKSELIKYREDYSKDNLIFAASLEKQLEEEINNICTVNDYEISTFGDSIFVNIPLYNFYGKVTSSPDGRYIAAGDRHMLSLIDTARDHLIYVYDIFHRVDNDSILITVHPFIVIRDIVALGSERQNDIYLLNHRSDILFKASLDANVYKLAIAENGEFVAAQTLDNKIRLYSVDSQQEIASWNTPNKVAIDFSIDVTAKEVRMLDYQNHVYSYSFENI